MKKKAFAIVAAIGAVATGIYFRIRGRHTAE